MRDPATKRGGLGWTRPVAGALVVIAHLVPVTPVRAQPAAVTVPAPGGAQQPPAAQGLGLVDAVRLTLARQPQIRLQESELRFAGGTLQAARGLFDVALASTLSAEREKLPLSSAERAGGREDVTADSLGWDVQATKLFSSGLRVTPRAEVAQVDSDAASVPDNRSRLSFTIVQPLWRGRGAGVVTAVATSAGFERDAAALELNHVVARTILQTVGAYWSYRARIRQLEIARQSEDRFARLAGDAEKLLAAREVAAVDIKQLNAIIALRRLTRLEAEYDLFEARQQLGLAAGLGARELLAIGLPTDGFPSSDPAAVPRELGPLVDLALSRRADLAASRLRQRAADVQVNAARDATRPQLDVFAETSWAGQGEREGLGGWFEPLGHRVAGPSAAGGLSFSWAPARRTALGRLAETSARAEQAGTLAGDLERTIPAQVALALEGLARSAERAAVARDARELYEFTVNAERQRLQLGISSVLDLINTEDRLTEAQAQEVSAQADFARALAGLRFETGTLLQGGTGREQQVDLATLTSPPPALGAPAPVPTP